ncbi:MAG TPA: PIN domain-containing protein [Gaiella sp.]|nr:PIN domain-containing protein [Gaiella sp.]
MRTLPDTSVWIDYFRGVEPAATELERLLVDEPPVICGPILAELVAGTPARQREDVWLALVSLPFVELGREAWTRAGELAHELREKGEAVPLLDLLIAVAAVQGDATLWSRDSDFGRVAAVLAGLRLRS